MANKYFAYELIERIRGRDIPSEIHVNARTPKAGLTRLRRDYPDAKIAFKAEVKCELYDLCSFGG